MLDLDGGKIPNCVSAALNSREGKLEGGLMRRMVNIKEEVVFFCKSHLHTYFVANYSR